MLELLISIMMSLGIHFTVVGDGKVEISSRDMNALQSSAEFQRSHITSMDGITVNDGIDPSSATQTVQ